MAAGVYTIFPGDGACRLAVARGANVELREAPIASMPSTLRNLGYAGQGVVLALPSEWCFAASINTSDLRRNDRAAMIYRLEEKLPVAAEEFVADFVVGSNGRALGVAVLTSKIEPLIDSLESAGVAVQSIVPAAFLAAGEAPVSDELRAFALERNDAIDLIAMRGDEIVALSRWPNNDEHLQLGLGLIDLEFGAKPQLVKLDSPDERAARGANQPSINLRRDALAARDRLRTHRRAIDAAITAAAIFLLAIAGACLLRAARYDRSIRQDQAQLADEYQRVFPGAEIPASVKAVVQSERRKLASRPGTAIDSAGGSALKSMQSILGSLPVQPRFSFDRMVFTDATFELSGRAPGVEALSAIRSAAQHAGWELAQPQAHRDGDGFWSFTIQGSRGANVASREDSQR